MKFFYICLMQMEKIVDWNRRQLIPVRLISVSEKGYVTPKGLMEKGMYICDCCGTVNSVDKDKCKECSEEKFIVLEK